MIIITESQIIFDFFKKAIVVSASLEFVVYQHRMKMYKVGDFITTFTCSTLFIIITTITIIIIKY